MSSAEGKNNYFGFGTDNDLEHEANYLIIKHSSFPLYEPVQGDKDYDSAYRIPCAKVLGAAQGRVKAFRPQSIVNISAMSFGSLSGHAIEALNRGAKMAGCLHNTGEGGISKHHLHGGDLIWQIGTAHFGCRDEQGKFDLQKLVERVQSTPVKAIEIKLSQGAKPSKGGILPAAKITREIAEIRGIPMGVDCISPSSHGEFHDADSLLDFVEKIADATGVPVGIKSAVGELKFWEDLSHLMDTTGRGVDFITLDGGEGGTGAAPLVFADYVSLPFVLGMSRVYRIFAERGITDDIVFIGSGRLGFPDRSLIGFALGCDLINVAREAMLSIGCIQAQKCETGHCPTGVTTQNWWLVRGLDPDIKSPWLTNYLITLRKELLQLSRACGILHPSLISHDHLELLDGNYGSREIQEIFNYQEDWGFPSAKDQEKICEIMSYRNIKA